MVCINFLGVGSGKTFPRPRSTKIYIPCWRTLLVTNVLHLSLICLQLVLVVTVWCI